MDIAQVTPLADTWMHGDWGWGWMSLMMAMMLLFWGAVIVGIVWLIRGAAPPPWAHGRDVNKETPVEILDRRFAEGEISEEDYRARREVLAGGSRTVGAA